MIREMAGDNSERMTAVDRLARRLEGEIFSAQLPPGMKLQPSALAPKYGVSTTPFRETLARLQSRGLVEIEPFVGARVAPVSLAEARDLYAVRLRLEQEALADSIERGEEDWEERLRKAMAELGRVSRGSVAKNSDFSAVIGPWLAAHREVHLGLLAACGSPWTLRLLTYIYDHLDRYAALAWDKGTLRSTSLDEHRDLVQSALGRDVDGAREALRVHLDSAMATLVEAIGEDEGAAEAETGAEPVGAAGRATAEAETVGAPGRAAKAETQPEGSAA